MRAAGDTDTGNLLPVRVRVDKLGRIVIPKHLRDRLGLVPGTELEIGEGYEADLELSVPATPMHLERDENGGLYAVADGPTPTLTPEQVRETLERLRR